MVVMLVIRETTASPSSLIDGYWFGSDKRGGPPEEAYRELEAMFGNMQRPRYTVS